MVVLTQEHIHTISENSLMFGSMSRTKFGASKGVLVESDFEKPLMMRLSSDVEMPYAYTLMTY
jgi:hypothetical protein